MEKQDGYLGLMNSSIRSIFKDAFFMCLGNPSLARFAYRTARLQKKAAKLRQSWEDKGVHVPPFLIASITNRCNLKCKGCYARAQNRPPEAEMASGRWRDLLEEARELGISIILLAGGEPLVRRDIIDAAGDFPEIVFPLFTNGTMLNGENIKELKKQRNIVPVISIEGFEKETDERRGTGIYKHVQLTMEDMKKQGMFFGVSITVTRDNFNTVTGDAFLRKLIDSGSRLFFFVEYIPVEEGTESLIPADEQRKSLESAAGRLQSKFHRLFIAFPGDERKFGGCLASGRGFAHISPEGHLEPCPFAPYSDSSVSELSLREALQSELLNKIRENHEYLNESQGGCALWNNRDWLRSIAGSSRCQAPQSSHTDAL
jgi:MoaA/NifB/PqqE/SkfB family radical SAM enzyme